MNTTFLYIPFNANEKPEELLALAEDWAKIYKQKHKLKEIMAEEGVYTPKNILICAVGDNQLQQVKSGDSVYILAHSLENSTDVSHSDGSDKFILTQDEVAKRISKEGLPESENFKLKLYYCDESNNAVKRTKQFLDGMKRHNQGRNLDNMALFYYPDVLLSVPKIPVGKDTPDKAYKKAVVRKHLLELQRNEIRDFLQESIIHMEGHQLKDFMSSLGKEIILKLISKTTDNGLLVALKEKAQIADVKKFINWLNNEASFTPEIYKEVGKAKDVRKKFNK